MEGKNENASAVSLLTRRALHWINKILCAFLSLSIHPFVSSASCVVSASHWIAEEIFFVSFFCSVVASGEDSWGKKFLWEKFVSLLVLWRKKAFPMLIFRLVLKLSDSKSTRLDGSTWKRFISWLASPGRRAGDLKYFSTCEEIVLRHGIKLAFHMGVKWEKASMVLTT